MSKLKEKLSRIVQEADDSLLEGLDNFVNHLREEQEPYNLSDAQKRELDQRMERYEAGEGMSHSWEDVKKSISKDA
ncbi:addiction module protein [Dokdonia sinensis]|nr:addiction module protein [Dokdonia sinensis]